MSSGKIVQVIGPVVDVEFSLDDTLPDINNALAVYKKMIEQDACCIGSYFRTWRWGNSCHFYGVY